MMQVATLITDAFERRSRGEVARRRHKRRAYRLHAAGAQRRIAVAGARLMVLASGCSGELPFSPL